MRIMSSLHTFLDTTSLQRISFARIGQENEKGMAGGEVMSGKGGKETGAMQYQKVAHCTRLGRNRAVVK